MELHNNRSKRRNLHDRLIIYRLILATSLFWICVDLCILAYLISENSLSSSSLSLPQSGLRVDIKSASFANPRAFLGNRDDDRLFRAEMLTTPMNAPSIELVNVHGHRQTPKVGDNSKIESFEASSRKHVETRVSTSQEENTNGSEENNNTVEIEEIREPSEEFVKEKSIDDIFGDTLTAEDYLSVPINPPDWPGENGAGVRIPEHLKEIEDRRFAENQFNILASDMVALNRFIPDSRHEKCKTRQFSAKLPTTSIVIVYHNEANSTLLRGLTSIVNRSPRRLLKEIILVDDASEKRDYLHADLDEFVKTKLAVPVIIFRNEKRLGLMRSRLRGAEAATGDTLTFLDAHIEVTIGWLPPLLAEVKRDSRSVVCPVIDVISDRDFSFRYGADTVYGGFDKSFVFNWHPVPERERLRRNLDPSLPIRSPTMAGGLFTIDRAYFYELGSYDDGMDIWGAENIEMSLRIWMCGGTLLIHPCSHVGHVFRSKSPYSFPGGAMNVVYKNQRRVVDVWTDEYREYFYYMIPGLKNVNAGDVSDRIKLKNDLKCKSFRWFLDTIFPEAPVPMDFYHVGQIKNDEIDYCLDSMGGEVNLGVFFCHNQESPNQLFVYSKQQTIANGKICLDLKKDNLPVTIKFTRCNRGKLSQKWSYNSKTKQFVNQELDNCMGINKFNRSVLITSRCDSKNPLQRWTLARSLIKSNLKL